VPLVATLHNYVLDQAFQSYGSTLQRLHWKTDLRLFHKLGVARADILIAVSQFTASLATQDLEIKKPIKVIYNGVDENQFIPKKRNISKEIKVLFSGNLTRRKGAHLLLPIIERLDKKIVIYYTSGLREQLKLVDHPRLRALGNVPHVKMPELYQSMDMLLFPTVREGHSIAVLEAMASGLPVVASNVASLPEQIVHEQGGFLCTLDDVDSFASAIQNLADDIISRKSLGDFNRAKVEENFTLQNMISNYNKIFSSY
jgi:glycosyltransferase involved in cell wall biosynthesis